MSSTDRIFDWTRSASSTEQWEARTPEGVRYTCVRVNGTSQKFFPRYGDQWLRSKRGTIYKARIEDCKDFCERHYVMRRGGDR